MQSGDQIESATLNCPACGAAYPVSAGIPRMLELDESRESDVKRREIEARDREWRQAEGGLATRRLPEIDAFRAAAGDCTGLRVLDAGCGRGEITGVALGAEHLLGVDFSLEGLLNFTLPRSPRLDLLQGDGSRLPFRDGAFDLTISSQVLEHLPSPEMRRAFIGELARTLRPGGRLVITAYNWDRNRKRRGESKEGHHASGIYYYAYLKDELVRELSEHFVVTDVWAVGTYLPKTYRLVKALGRANTYWDRFWRTRNVSFLYSRLLMATCSKPID